MRRTWYGCCISVLWALALAACGVSQPAAGNPLPAPTDPPDANLFLSLLNASQRVEEIDIRVFVDDELLVEERLQAGTNELGIINHRRLAFKLPAGSHTLKVVSLKGGANFTEQITIEGPTHVLIGYEYSPGPPPDTPPGQFGIQVQDMPFRFQ